MPVQYPALVYMVAEAIAHFEGFYRNDTKTLAKRNNNPGNLRSWGSNPVENGYAKFPNLHEGFKALHRQCWLNLYQRELTFDEFFGGKKGVYPGYAPAEDHNDPLNYAQFVRDFLRDRCMLMINDGPRTTS